MMYNPSGFDDSDLLLDPEARQRSMPGSAQNQGDKVSEPYRQAMMMAAAKTNPMNAVSQEPGKAFLDQYRQKGGMEQVETAQMFNPFDLLGGGTQKALEAGDRARAGEDPQVDQRTPMGRMLNRNAATAAMYNQMLGGR